MAHANGVQALYNVVLTHRGYTINARHEETYGLCQRQMAWPEMAILPNARGLLNQAAPTR